MCHHECVFVGGRIAPVLTEPRGSSPRPRSMRRATTWGLALALLLLTGCGTGSGQGSAAGSDSRQIALASSRLPRQQALFARHIARVEIRRQRSHVRLAVAELHPGRVRLSNTGFRCDSGTLLRVRLIGRFPHTIIAPTPGGSATVRSEVIEADPATGRECLIGFGTKHLRVHPGAVRVPLYNR
jgi:hypothetical protein